MRVVTNLDPLGMGEDDIWTNSHVPSKHQPAPLSDMCVVVIVQQSQAMQIHARVKQVEQQSGSPKRAVGHGLL